MRVRELGGAPLRRRSACVVEDRGRSRIAHELEHELAFVVAEQHPNHVAFKVCGEELERLGGANEVEIVEHRDGTRSFYLEAPGGHPVEVISYPDAVDEARE